MGEQINRKVREEKLQRLRRGSAPRTLDLFAGAGGLSLGFVTAGFQAIGGVELDNYAAQTFAENFFDNEEEINHHGTGRDIRETEPEDLFRDVDSDEVAARVDVLVGGPPCQSYARVGRAKLREVDENSKAHLEDDRGNLYLRYLHYVRKLEPLVIIIENIPDALNYGGHNIAEEIAEVLREHGYSCSYTLLNSAFYGVPQMRERMFLIGQAEEFESEVGFPEPTHWIDLPSGYGNVRDHALKRVRENSLFKGGQGGHFVKSPSASSDLPSAVTVEDALHDLPTITRHLRGNPPRGPRSFDELQPYPETDEPADYGKLMRNWPGFESPGGIYDHRNGIRHTPRDYRIFRRMEGGDQYPEAHEKALNLFRERLDEKCERGRAIEKDSDEYEALKREIVPPYDPSKFPNKWRKMEADEPARTLTAHLCKDAYSHIHYDSNQARTISVREAARLQSFPDGFVFSGSMGSAFRQIGNAVPPLVAYHLAKRIADTLNFSSDQSLPDPHSHYALNQQVADPGYN